MFSFLKSNRGAEIEKLVKANCELFDHLTEANAYGAAQRERGNRYCAQVIKLSAENAILRGMVPVRGDRGRFVSKQLNSITAV